MRAELRPSARRPRQTRAVDRELRLVDSLRPGLPVGLHEHHPTHQHWVCANDCLGYPALGSRADGIFPQPRLRRRDRHHDMPSGLVQLGAMAFVAMTYIMLTLQETVEDSTQVVPASAGHLAVHLDRFRHFHQRRLDGPLDADRRAAPRPAGLRGRSQSVQRLIGPESPGGDGEQSGYRLSGDSPSFWRSRLPRRSFSCCTSTLCSA